MKRWFVYDPITYANEYYETESEAMREANDLVSYLLENNFEGQSLAAEYVQVGRVTHVCAKTNETASGYYMKETK